MNALITLNTVVSVNLILAFFVLFFKKNNSIPNKILAFIIINPAINFVANVLNLYGVAKDFSYFIYISIITALLFGPLVYSYVVLMMGMRFNRKNPVFFLTGLAILYYVYVLVGIELEGPDAVNAFFTGLEKGPYPEEMEVLDAIFILLQQVYFSMALLQYIRYKGKLKSVFSNFNNTKEHFVLYFILFIWLLNLVTIALYAILPFYDVQNIYLPIVLLAIFLFIFLAAFNFQSVFNKDEYELFVAHNEVIEENLESKTRQGNIDQEEKLSLIATLLIEKMEEGYYTNPNLNVKMLAELINEPIYLVSKCLRQHLNKSFFEFVNEYRVASFEEKLQLENNLTIEGIALEVGFSNRASFYRIYKKMTGKTPSDTVSENIK